MTPPLLMGNVAMKPALEQPLVKQMVWKYKWILLVDAPTAAQYQVWQYSSRVDLLPTFRVDHACSLECDSGVKQTQAMTTQS